MVISGILGKAKGQVHRLALVTQGMESACNLLDRLELSTKDELTPTFIGKINDYLASNPPQQNDFVITKECADRSVNLIKYFINHKKMLSGYRLNEDTSAPPPAIDKSDKQVMVKTLQTAGPVVKCPDINTGKGPYKKENIERIFLELQSYNVGHVREMAPRKGGKLCNAFIKVQTSNLSVDGLLELTEFLAKIGMTINEYEEALKPERNPLADVTNNNKRDSSSISHDNDSDDEVTFKKSNV